MDPRKTLAQGVTDNGLKLGVAPNTLQKIYGGPNAWELFFVSKKIQKQIMGQLSQKKYGLGSQYVFHF